MKFTHSFEVAAPLAEVAAFHARASSLGAITPPPIIMQIHEAPPQLGEGDSMEFTLWLGPLPITWRAIIEDVSPNGFVDRQVQGPFTKWEHQHRFVELGPDRTRVDDHIEAQYKRHPLWAFIGWGMWTTLPMLFFYRQWQTKRRLEKATPRKVSA